MGTKRTAEDAELSLSRTHPRMMKSAKLTPSAEEAVDSSRPSTCSVSDDSALHTTPPKDEHLHHDSISSSQLSCSDGASESSPRRSELSGDSDGMSDSEDGMLTLGGPKKPVISRNMVMEGAGDLRSRLEALLPQIAMANDMLLADNGTYCIEDVKEDEDYIEMNLGLGVLEEKTGDPSSSASDDTSDVDGSENEDISTSPTSGDGRSHGKDFQQGKMDKLLGRRLQQRKLDIQELG